MNDSTNFDNFHMDWRLLTGKLPIRLTNDYLFKCVAETNETVLKALISTSLHLDLNMIKSTEVTNPITPGMAINDKVFVLDVKLLMNNNTTIDLEMQVLNDHDWPERSLQYLCRTYDSLHRGDDYKDSKTTIHIGLLDFELFPGESILFDSFRMMSIFSHKVYTEKFQLYTICLRKADDATPEDRKFHTDLWARFFKATTWEELKMLADQDIAIAEATKSVHAMWEDQNIRDQILAREEFYARERAQKRKLQQETERADVAEKRADSMQKQADELEAELRKYKERFGNIDFSTEK